MFANRGELGLYCRELYCRELYCIEFDCGGYFLGCVCNPGYRLASNLVVTRVEDTT